jgi:signal transduction histidine kinase
VSVRFKQTGNYYNSKATKIGLAQVSNDEDPKKLEPLTVPRIIEQLERALMDIKYKQSDDELVFNNIENVSIESKTRPQFIGKELMLFEMIGILNGKITELQKKYQKLKSLEDREEEFVSSKANQITEPLQDILEYAKLAKLGQMDPNEALEGVLRVAKKLQNVTTVVLDTNRVTNDSLTLSKKNLNINEIISDVIDSTKSVAVTVPIRVGLDHDIEIPVDRVRLSQVIQTILNNSIKYTKTGHIKVESFVAHQQNLFIIRINDTGKGIPKEILSKIFDKEITGNRKDGNDTKLSLYLCQGIIEAHGGKITTKNNEGVGCTFTITLPIKKN